MKAMAKGEAKGPAVVKVWGTHHDVGYELGKACRDEAKRGMDAAFRTDLRRAGVPWEGALKYSRRVLPFVEDFHADFLEEFRGYGEAAGFAPEEIVALWSGYPGVAGSRGCTDVAVGPRLTADGSTLVGHNEDHYVDYADLVVPVHVEPKGKPAFFALSYRGLFPTMGFNDEGISLTGNASAPTTRLSGFQRCFRPAGCWRPAA